METDNETQKEKKMSPAVFLTPASILIAGLLVATAIMTSNSDVPNGAVVNVVNDNSVQDQQAEMALLENVAPITAKDHIRGNPNAPIKIIEYTDFECPFCKRFHSTMNEVMQKYGSSGEVAWVFRHMPLDELHPIKARTEAWASECIAELGGKDAFWLFTDRFFEVSPSNNQTDLAILPKIAEELGIDSAEFETCLNSEKYDDLINAHTQNANETGGYGTPWSILIAEKGDKYPINGAQPLEHVVNLIESVL